MPDSFSAIDESDYQSAFVRLEFLIDDAARMRRSLMDQAFRPLGITRSQWMVLNALSRSGPGGVMQADLARLLEITKAPVGGLIERLEASGHVTRSGDAQDRRIKRVVLTQFGRETLARMAEVERQINKRLYRNYTPAQRHVVEDILSDLKQNMRTVVKELVRDRGASSLDESNLSSLQAQMVD